MTSRPLDPALLSRRLFTREEFERAGELGLFQPGERLELIGGEVVRKMSPQKSPHAAAIRRAEEALRRAFSRGHDVRVQLPLALHDDSAPEPDLSVVSGGFDEYEREHPRTAVLVFEVADTTLTYDRTIKASLYASSGVPDYWILNLRERVLEVRRDPEADPASPFGSRYRTSLRFEAEDTVAPLHAPSHPLAVAELLPRTTPVTL